MNYVKSHAPPNLCSLTLKMTRSLFPFINRHYLILSKFVALSLSHYNVTTILLDNRTQN